MNKPPTTGPQTPRLLLLQFHGRHIPVVSDRQEESCTEVLEVISKGDADRRTLDSVTNHRDEMICKLFIKRNDFEDKNTNHTMQICDLKCFNFKWMALILNFNGFSVARLREQN